MEKSVLRTRKPNRLYFYLFLAVVTAVFAYVLWPLKDLILMAYILVTLFMPVYRYFERTVKLPKAVATTVALLVVTFTILIPVAIIINLTLSQIKVFYSDINAFLSGGTSMYSLTVGLFNKINDFLARIPFVEYRLSIDGLKLAIQQNLAPVLNSVLGWSVNFSVSFFEGIPLFIVFLFLLWYGFPDYERVLGFLRRMSPLPGEVDDMYINRINATIRGLVKGTFTIAVVQGAIAGLSFFIAGVPYPLFWTLIMIFVSIVPVGSWIVSIPAGVIMILLGNYWQGIFILLVHTLITSNIDNVLRPMLITKEAAIHPALFLVSIFGGIKIFGPLGFVYGPLIVVVMMTTYEVYQKYYKAE